MLPAPWLAGFRRASAHYDPADERESRRSTRAPGFMRPGWDSGQRLLLGCVKFSQYCVALLVVVI